jgi:hypothetical protein
MAILIDFKIIYSLTLLSLQKLASSVCLIAVKNQEYIFCFDLIILRLLYLRSTLFCETLTLSLSFTYLQPEWCRVSARMIWILNGKVKILLNGMSGLYRRPFRITKAFQTRLASQTSSEVRIMLLGNLLLGGLGACQKALLSCPVRYWPSVSPRS